MHMNGRNHRIVFLISQPKSGSTLLQAILGSHSKIGTTTEPWVALAPVSFWRNDACEFDFDGKLWKQTLTAFYAEAQISETYLRTSIRVYLYSLYDQALKSSENLFFLTKRLVTTKFYRSFMLLFPKRNSYCFTEIPPMF